MISSRQPKRYNPLFAVWISGLIGEALNRISQTDKEVLSNISEHHRIIAFRNILIHGYDVIDEAIVYNAVKNHLPILVRDVKKIINT